MTTINLTQQDKEMFLALNASVMGKQMIDYLGRLSTHLCDIRNIDEPTPEYLKAIKTAVNLFTEELSGRIICTDPKKDADANKQFV